MSSWPLPSRPLDAGPVRVRVVDALTQKVREDGRAVNVQR